MKILAIDTSTKACSCAVCEENKILFESVCNVKITHSQTIMPMVEDMLKNAKIKISDIDYFAVAKGPGSFTGIRIGISAIKGFCTATRNKCASISSLTALAYGCRDLNGIIIPVIDARNDRVFYSIFDNSQGEMVQIEQDNTINISELENKIKNYEFNVYFVGDGALLCYNNLWQACNNIKCVSESLNVIRASNTAFAAINDIKSGILYDEDGILPVYIQIPQAQAALSQKTIKE